ncbi:hypothetical protein EYF80_047049 [Liparis tanakae]|uniref:Uncharacterized protein n=1 Tax=Liparis tanakae TaxID=230148 RepID=A0A4Z2FPN8_9TELE|nr:hypothetical protein EYF80_047049 [Liparis tanakae]
MDIYGVMLETSNTPATVRTDAHVSRAARRAPGVPGVGGARGGGVGAGSEETIRWSTAAQTSSSRRSIALRTFRDSMGWISQILRG